MNYKMLDTVNIKKKNLNFEAESSHRLKSQTAGSSIHPDVTFLVGTVYISYSPITKLILKSSEGHFAPWKSN